MRTGLGFGRGRRWSRYRRQRFGRRRHRRRLALIGREAAQGVGADVRPEEGDVVDVVIVAGEDIARDDVIFRDVGIRSEEHTSELQSLMRTSYAVFCLKKKKQQIQ